MTQESEDFGAYHPGAAQHRPYWENMAAWRNQVASETGVSGYAEPPAERVEQVEQDMATAEDRWVERLDPEENPDPSAYRFEDGDVVEAIPVPLEGPEEPLTGSEALEVFDPSEHTAPVVLEHLKDAPRSEVVRVLTAEKGGKARKGILKLEAELLAPASE